MQPTPLVSFLLFTYNQSRWIREAVRAALAQDYPNLEIIVSDDCSTDDTAALAEDEARSTRGPHTARVQKTPQNLGIGPHVAQVVRQARGELLVFAAGDDVSLPARVSRIVEAWVARGRGSMLFQSRYQSIDEVGNRLPSMDGPWPAESHFDDVEDVCRRNLFITGATEAATADLFTAFPPFLPELVHEDRCLPFRTRLLGAPVVSLTDALVLYRRAGISASYAAPKLTRAQARTLFHRFAVDFEQKRLDALSRGRSDLLPLIDRQHAAYTFAQRCADDGADWRQLASDATATPPPLLFALKQLAKYRLGPVSRLFGYR